MAGIQRNGSLGASAPEGVQTAFVQGSGTTPGAFSQNVLLAAGNYQVKFKAARRATGNGVPIQVAIDNTTIGAPIDPASTAFAAYSTASFAVQKSGSYLLRFSTPSNSGISMSLIDDVTIEAAGAATIILPLPMAPATPTGLAATFSGNRVTLTWNAVPDHPTYGYPLYKVKRATAPGGPYTLLAPSIRPATFSDEGVTLGTTYYYRVYAFNSANNGGRFGRSERRAARRSGR